MDFNPALSRTVRGLWLTNPKPRSQFPVPPVPPVPLTLVAICAEKRKNAAEEKKPETETTDWFLQGGTETSHRARARVCVRGGGRGERDVGVSSVCLQSCVFARTDPHNQFVSVLQLRTETTRARAHTHKHDDDDDDDLLTGGARPSWVM